MHKISAFKLKWSIACAQAEALYPAVWATVASDLCSWLPGEEPDVGWCVVGCSGDAFLLNTGVKSDYLSSHLLPVSSDQWFSCELSGHRGI